MYHLSFDLQLDLKKKQKNTESHLDSISDFNLTYNQHHLEVVCFTFMHQYFIIQLDS